MKMEIYCIPCVVNQARNLAQKHLDSEKEQYKLIKQVLQEMGSKEQDETCAPLMAQKIHRLVREATGIQDHYEEVKKFYNQKMLEMEKEFFLFIEKAEDQLSAALKLAAAGNIIDFGAKADLQPEEVYRVIRETMEKKFPENIFRQLKKDLAKAGTLLYLGDNAGEIVFDKLFVKCIKQYYPELKIYFATRGKPVINDVTEEDAHEVGMAEHAEIISNGTDIPGTILRDCSPDFRQVFARADVIISKGQGNFESLIDHPENIYFIFLCKCSLFQEKLGVNQHDIVLHHGSLPPSGPTSP